MNLSQVHLDFWQIKHPLPQWAIGFAQRRMPTIQDCINSHAQQKRSDGELACHNLVNLLRSMRKGEPLRKRLAYLAVSPGTIIHPEKRAAYARKWLARLGGTAPLSFAEQAARARVQIH